MDDCHVCQHAKIQAIEASLASGVLAGVVATQFRVKKLDLVKHLQHALIQALPACSTLPPLQGIAEVIERLSIQGPPVDPIRRLQHHVEEAARIWWDEVDVERRSPERLQLILDEAFADPNMGL